MTNASPPRLIFPPRGSAVTSNLRFCRYFSRATAQLAFFRRLCFALFFFVADFFALVRRLPLTLAAAPPLSPFTLRRSASIKLITLLGLGEGVEGGALPVFFALIRSRSASSYRSSNSEGSK